ncbi:rhomboid family intramembrane serine protease [Candidatus Woesearchaeota archaeon]|nr:rhomboid family intramembrane serine protease [Candidatus Woesearchaeota archaeon]
MEHIESEAEFTWKQFKFVLKLPWLLLLIFIGRRSWRELLQPLRDLLVFFFEPRATMLLILAIIAVYIYQVFFMTEELFRQLVFEPRNVLEGNVFPMMASWFLHANFVHLLGNIIALAVFGRIVERKLGSWQLLSIYFGAAIISDLIAAIFGQGGIGASGAIAGLISTAILINPFYLTHFLFGIPLPAMLIGWAMMITDIMGVLVPKNDNIGHIAHLGGYMATAFLVFLFNQEERKKMKRGLIINVLFVASAGALWFWLRFQNIV